MTALIAAEWGLPDRAALGWFLLAWLGYGPLIQHLRSPASITARLRGIRRAWMRAMLDRDNRITDASLIGHPMHSATFFASTTMIALVALLGMLGNMDRTHGAVDALAFTAKASRPMVEAKVLLDPPPLKWSASRHGFEPEEDRDGEQEAPAGGGPGQAAASGRAGVAG